MMSKKEKCDYFKEFIKITDCFVESANVLKDIAENFDMEKSDEEGRCWSHTDKLAVLFGIDDSFGGISLRCFAGRCGKSPRERPRGLSAVFGYLFDQLGLVVLAAGDDYVLDLEPDNFQVGAFVGFFLH